MGSGRDGEGEVSLLPTVDGGRQAERPPEGLPQDRLPRGPPSNHHGLDTNGEIGKIFSKAGERETEGSRERQTEEETQESSTINKHSEETSDGDQTYSSSSCCYQYH